MKEAVDGMSNSAKLLVAASPARGGVGRRCVSAWLRFADANKRFCRSQLQPRLFPVGHMAALELWFARRLGDGGGHLLEFGCGRTFHLTRLLGGRFTQRSATDIAPVASADVPEGVDFRQCTSRQLPFDAEQFDVVVIRSVVEHIEDPVLTFQELARVVRPGGRVLMNLPNKWDYVSILARLSGRFKSAILKGVVRTGWEDFPVWYRCNTRAALEASVECSGWQVEQFRPLPSQPSYLAFFVPFYVVGAMYQFVISLLFLDILQPSFVVILRRGQRDA
jgi:SAM-dependent methyltransferase